VRKIIGKSGEHAVGVGWRSAVDVGYRNNDRCFLAKVFVESRILAVLNGVMLALGVKTNEVLVPDTARLMDEFPRRIVDYYAGWILQTVNLIVSPETTTGNAYHQNLRGPGCITSIR
jgi:hypothetical protein